MIFGGTGEDLIQLNETTLWSGGPVKQNVNPESASYLPLVRKALLEENNYSKADSLLKKMQGNFTESYLPMGDLVLNQDFKNGQPTEYYRELDLTTAITTTRFNVGKISFTRQYFVNAPANVMVIVVRSSVKASINLQVKASSQLRYQLSAINNTELQLHGKAPAKVDPSYYNPEGRTPGDL